MSWDEPRAIAERLAAALGMPLRGVREPSRDGELLFVDGDEQLGRVGDGRLASAAVAVVCGAPGSGTSETLSALRERVAAAAGADPSLATFATRWEDERPDELALVVVASAERERERVEQLLAAGPHGLPLDGAVDVAGTTAADRGARVCVVSFELAGMTGGGIGTASTALADALAARGHDVTFLFTGWQEPGAEAANERWRRRCADRGVQLEFLREPGVSSARSPYLTAATAWEVHCWLRERAFDVVHLPENSGQGLFAQLAKAQGSAHAATTFAIGTHGSTRWAAEANRVALTREEFLVNDAFERASVERADVLLGPSRYLHDYKRQRGWRLPARVHVQPYATPQAVRPDVARVPAPVQARSAAGKRVAGAADAGGDDERELVFFGRLETRKGVVTLCDALDLLVGDDELPALSVTFLGPIAEVLGERSDRYIAQRAARWPWRWEIVDDLDQRGAAERLSAPGVLAAMPSTVDNAPNTVSEAIALGIPFVAGAAGGTGELIAAEQRDAHMFGASTATLQPVPLAVPAPAGDADRLARLLRRRLTTRVEPARPPCAPEAVDEAYDRWHRAVARAADAAAAQVAPATAPPSLPAAVCLLFDGDHELLAAQLAALSGCELVVADLRAAAEPPAAAVERGVAVVRPRRPGHAADARTAAAAATRAELIVIVPPADLPLAELPDALGRAAARSGADVCACAVLDGIADDGDGDDEAAPPAHAFVPIAGPATAGLGHPAFSVGPYAVRRAALERLGGWAQDARADEADHELLNRAAVGGLRFEVVAEPLAVKRRRDRWSDLRAVGSPAAADPPYDAEQWLRIERPFSASALTSDLVALLRGARGDAAATAARLVELQEAYERRSHDQRLWIDDAEAKLAELRADWRFQLSEAERLTALNQELARKTAPAAYLVVRDLLKRIARRLR
jgi:glycosyltransferase involved in cell wall biosynthesis